MRACLPPEPADRRGVRATECVFNLRYRSGERLFRGRLRRPAMVHLLRLSLAELAARSRVTGHFVDARHQRTIHPLRHASGSTSSDGRMRHGTTGWARPRSAPGGSRDGAAAASIDLSGEYCDLGPIPCTVTLVQTGTAPRAERLLFRWFDNLPVPPRRHRRSGHGRVLHHRAILDSAPITRVAAQATARRAQITCTSSTDVCTGPSWPPSARKRSDRCSGKLRGRQSDRRRLLLGALSG